MLKIARKIHGGKIVTTFLNTDEISVPVISEQVSEPIELYDIDGNLVETKEPTEKWFKVVVIFKQNGFHKDYFVTETECDKIVAALEKTSK